MSTTTHARRSRRDDVEAVEVGLADGHRWGLALPGPRTYPRVVRGLDLSGRPTVGIEPVAEVGYPLGVRRLWDELFEACRGEAPASPERAFRRLTIALLRMAHDIEPAAAEALVDPRVVDLDAVARSLIPAAFGQAELPHNVAR